MHTVVSLSPFPDRRATPMRPYRPVSHGNISFSQVSVTFWRPRDSLSLDRCIWNPGGIIVVPEASLVSCWCFHPSPLFLHTHLLVGGEFIPGPIWHRMLMLASCFWDHKRIHLFLFRLYVSSQQGDHFHQTAKTKHFVPFTWVFFLYFFILGSAVTDTRNFPQTQSTNT